MPSHNTYRYGEPEMNHYTYDQLQRIRDVVPDYQFNNPYLATPRINAAGVEVDGILAQIEPRAFYHVANTQQSKSSHNRAKIEIEPRKSVPKVKKVAKGKKRPAQKPKVLDENLAPEDGVYESKTGAYNSYESFRMWLEVMAPQEKQEEEDANVKIDKAEKALRKHDKMIKAQARRARNQGKRAKMNCH